MFVQLNLASKLCFISVGICLIWPVINSPIWFLVTTICCFVSSTESFSQDISASYLMYNPVVIKTINKISLKSSTVGLLIAEINCCQMFTSNISFVSSQQTSNIYFYPMVFKFFLVEIFLLMSNHFQSTLGNSSTKSKKHLLMSKKTFDAVEKKMNHIQASLSSTSLVKAPSVAGSNIQGQNQGQISESEDCTVIRLRRELEDKEKLAQK